MIETAPGEECQVDYGEGPMVRDPLSGSYRRTRLFVMTLGYSRKSVRLMVFSSSSQIWAELHEKAFPRIGGVPRVVVLDNLREGVLEPDIYDPTLNPLYRDVLQHYGAVALPCRIADPDRKGKVESSVGHAQKTPLKGMRFETLEEAQSYLDRWEERWADTRIHGTTKRQVAAMFAEERPALLPLPIEPFRYYQYGERTVHLDGCVEVDAAYYSAPPGWIGRRVQVQWDDGTSACWIRRPANCCASTCIRRAAPSDSGRGPPQENAFTTRQLLGAPRAAIQSACSQRWMRRTDSPPCAAFRGFCRWPRNTAPPRGRRLFGRLPSKSTNTILSAAIWNGKHQRHSASASRSADPPAHAVSRLHRTGTQSQSKPTWRKSGMNLIELERALGQLRLGGMAAVLETRLKQAQAEAMAPIDLISCLISDELTRRSDRLLDRRRKQAGFRDPHKTLDNFDFTFNPKMNRSLVFDLATGAFITRGKTRSFSVPVGLARVTCASHRPRCHSTRLPRAVPRNTPAAGRSRRGRCGRYAQAVHGVDSSVPLLIVDDFGMRKLPHTAAEDLLEIVMRRYERASTLLTSNRPVEDWGKLLGDVAAVSAMLDRLLHHGHVLKCGPRSWRTKTALPAAE